MAPNKQLDKHDKLSDDNNGSFLHRLSTLRSHAIAIGMSHSESELSNALRRSGFNVHSALERLLSIGDARRGDAANANANAKGQKNFPVCRVRPIPKDRKTEPIEPSSTATPLLLLCKRWTTAISKSNGSITHSEKLHFTHSTNATTSTTPTDPMVRFHSDSNRTNGTLDPTLCRILSPLIPWISLKGTALMQERLVIGSDIPLALEVFVNAGFFKLFEGEHERKQRHVRRGKCGLTRAEAAFRLLQWAERGEEVREAMAIEMVKEVEDKTLTPSCPTSEEDVDVNICDEDLVVSEKVQLDELLPSHSQSINGTVLPKTSDPEGLHVELRPYQRHALSWMCHREDPSTESSDELLSSLAPHSSYAPSIGISCDCGPVMVADSIALCAPPVCDYGEPTLGRVHRHHPLWERRFLADESLTRVYAFYVNEIQRVGTASLPDPPRQCVGGILADAMGLGKTVMILSLILASKELEQRHGTTKGDPVIIDLVSDGEESVQESDRKRKYDMIEGCGTTLIIAPLSLISQWEEEVVSKTNLSVLAYYDASSKKVARGDSFSSVDVVVTTYGTLQSEFASLSRADITASKLTPGPGQPLLSFRWKRVVLDEAHCIKNPGTVVSKACCSLRAEKRWCVTGTPIQNSLQDVYGLLKFLRHEPWCDVSFWKNAITYATTAEGGTMSAEKHEPSIIPSVAFGRVRRVLAPILLRRTKDTLAEDGKPILSLPPIESSVVKVTLSPPEREFYNALLEKSQSVFDGYVRAGTAAKSYFAIFSLLQRLRQSCDHVSLTVQNRHNTNDIGGIDDQDAGMIALSSSEGVINTKFLGELVNKFKKKTVGGAINANFLEDLMNKFKRNLVGNEDSEGTAAFVKGVATELSQCIETSEEYLKTECPICLDEPRVADAVHTPCAHMFCKMCLLNEFQSQQNRRMTKPPATLKGKSSEVSRNGGNCPVCDRWIKISRVIQVQKLESGGMIPIYLNEKPTERDNMPRSLAQRRDRAARETLESALNGSSSSKLEAILSELETIWSLNPGSKILFFSQFLGFLDLIGNALKRCNITFFRIDGEMSLKERVVTIENFNRGPGRSVFLVSMKAGGVGLNLVAASTVFILDPWWNMAVEDQCINRIHRIGQEAEIVRVRKFIVTDTVEEKIVKLQEKKKGMANDILNDVDGSEEVSVAKPTLEDFKLLFGR